MIDPPADNSGCDQAAAGAAPADPTAADVLAAAQDSATAEARGYRRGFHDSTHQHRLIFLGALAALAGLAVGLELAKRLPRPEAA